jgi:hypothetical protein
VTANWRPFVRCWAHASAPRAERGDVDVEGWLVALVVDGETQVADAPSVREGTELGVACQVADERDGVDVGVVVLIWFLLDVAGLLLRDRDRTLWRTERGLA